MNKIIYCATLTVGNVTRRSVVKHVSGNGCNSVYKVVMYKSSRVSKTATVDTGRVVAIKLGMKFIEEIIDDEK